MDFEDEDNKPNLEELDSIRELTDEASKRPHPHMDMHADSLQDACNVLREHTFDDEAIKDFELEHSNLLNKQIDDIDQIEAESTEENVEDESAYSKAKSDFRTLAVNILKDSTMYEPNNPENE